MLLQLQDFGTSLWQLHEHATSSPRRLKGALRTGARWRLMCRFSHAGMSSQRAGAARRQMQPKAAHVLRCGGVGRAAEKRSEVLDPLHVVMLGFRRELADCYQQRELHLKSAV
jgi:hypothetical protein